MRQRKGGQSQNHSGSSPQSAGTGGHGGSGSVSSNQNNHHQVEQPSTSQPPHQRPFGRFGAKQPKLLRRAKTRGIGYMATAKVLVGAVVLLVAAYFGYRGYLETRVNTPFDIEKV